MQHSALTVKISELRVATADGCDELVSPLVAEVLRMLRAQMEMDVVFVSEFTESERVFRFVDGGPRKGDRVESESALPALAAGDANPLEESFCKQVVDGRLPQRIANVQALPAATRAGLPHVPFRLGAHVSVPIRLKDGSAYGTLCCFSQAANDKLTERDMTQLRQVAEVLARRVEKARSDSAAGGPA